jgi:hypothetical protein
MDLLGAAYSDSEGDDDASTTPEQESKGLTHIANKVWDLHKGFPILISSLGRDLHRSPTPVVCASCTNGERIIIAFMFTSSDKEASTRRPASGQAGGCSSGRLGRGRREVP